MDNENVTQLLVRENFTELHPIKVHNLYLVHDVHRYFDF